MLVLVLLAAASNAYAGEGKTCLDCDDGPAAPPPPPPTGDGSNASSQSSGDGTTDGDDTSGDYDTSSSEPSIRDEHPEWNEYHPEEDGNGDTVRTIVHYRYAPITGLRFASPPIVMTPAAKPSEHERSIIKKDLDRTPAREWRNPLGMSTSGGLPPKLTPMTSNGSLPYPMPAKGQLAAKGQQIANRMPDERSKKDMGDVAHIVDAAASGDLVAVDQAVRDATGVAGYFFNPETVSTPPRKVEDVIEDIGAWIAEVWAKSIAKVGY